jgi:hypothetical protein
VIAVSVTPLWFRDEIEAYADERERRAQNLTA